MLPNHDLDVVVLANRPLDVQDVALQAAAAVLGDRIEPATAEPLAADHADLLVRDFLEPETGLLLRFVAEGEGQAARIVVHRMGAPAGLAYPLDAASAQSRPTAEPAGGLLPFTVGQGERALHLGVVARDGRGVAAIAIGESGTWRTAVRLDAAQVFPLPNEKRERAFLIKNISFENLSTGDLFARGWHRSGYLFGIDRADVDGWVDRKIAFSFPATTQFKTAVVEIIRFPAKADLPLTVGINGAAQPALNLELEKTERITIPLSADQATALTLDAPRNFALAAPDTRLRSFRIVNIDFQ
jgi:hypothetical protein